MNAYSNYLKHELENASSEEIMLKLMEGAALRLGMAHSCWQNNEKIRAREFRCRALEIITYLDNTLDMESAPSEIGENLDGLYAYMISEINEATRKEDFERLLPVKEIMQDIYTGFKDAVQEEKKQNSGAAKNSDYTYSTGKEQRSGLTIQG